MNYGRAIRIARAARGWTQRELAAHASLDPSTLSLIECGRRSVSVESVEALSSALGLPPFLLTFAASDESDLVGCTPEQAGRLAGELMKLFREMLE